MSITNLFTLMHQDRRDMANRHPARGREAGFTIFEVLVAGIVLSVVMLCLVRAWGLVDRMSLDLQLKQKAAFVLNGEAERLSLLYDTGALFQQLPGPTAGTSLQAVSGPDYSTLTGISGSGNRMVYSTTTLVASGFTTSSQTTFGSATSDYEVWATGSGQQTQNFVWLDRTRSIMARLSWVECPLSANTSGSQGTDNSASVCWGRSKSHTPNALCYAFVGGSGGTPCLLITVVLDYPYLLQNGTPVAASPSILTSATLTLNTIVGRRA